MRYLTRIQRLLTGGALLLSVLTGVLSIAGANDVLVFVLAGCALALLATVVGSGTEALGEHLGPSATGIVQAALGNLPELFVAIFALRSGLVEVVQASIVGSILGNSLLVLGMAFLLGGWRHGVQKFETGPPRAIANLLLLAVSALVIPTLAYELHTPAAAHADSLSIVCAILLLLVFASSVIVSLSNGPAPIPPSEPAEESVAMPLGIALGLLSAGALGAAFVSDWFVDALTPAAHSLGISETFTGLVIVAIAGNAVEHVVGIQLAMKNKSDFAVSVIMNSSLQVALALAPMLVLLSLVIGAPTHLTLVLPPLLVSVLFIAAIIGTVIVYDGESTWLEGAILVALYGVIATSFWWG